MTSREISVQDVRAWIEAFAAVVSENRQYLTKLDSAIGDADHGINMDRGFRAVLEKLTSTNGEDIGLVLKTVGMTLISKVGGASGPLYGTLFMQLGAATAGKETLTPEEWMEALRAGVLAVAARGKAEQGDKTMLDSLLPAVGALEQGLGDGFSAALHRAEQAARAGMEATVPLVARKGRASYLGERSAGHQDPGATSSYLLVKAAADTWGAAEGAEVKEE